MPSPQQRDYAPGDLAATARCGLRDLATAKEVGRMRSAATMGGQGDLAAAARGGRGENGQGRGRGGGAPGASPGALHVMQSRIKRGTRGQTRKPVSAVVPVQLKSTSSL